MGSPLSSLSSSPVLNSPATQVASSFLDTCVTILRKGPPLSESGYQSVTSGLSSKPAGIQSSSYIPYIIGAGVIALIGVAILLARIAAAHFSSLPENKPKAPDLTDVRVAAQPPTAQGNGSHPQPQPPVSPIGAPVDPPPSPSPLLPPQRPSSSSSLLPSAPGCDADEKGKAPSLHGSTSKSSTKGRGSEEKKVKESPRSSKAPSRASVYGAESSESSDDDNESESSSGKEVSQLEQLRYLQINPPVSISSELEALLVEAESAQASDQQPTSMLGRFIAGVNTYLFDARHISKWMKYRIIQTTLEFVARSLNIKKCSKEGMSDIEAAIITTWDKLVSALTHPTLFTTADEQYVTTAKLLREMKVWYIAADKELREKFSTEFQLARKLSYFRFAGIGFYPYCLQLILMATRMRLPRVLSLDTFLDELKARRKALNNPIVPAMGMNGFAYRWYQTRATNGVRFDPLLESNVPYIDGQITLNGKSTLILRHGVPVEQDNPDGLGLTLVQKAVDRFGLRPALKYIIPNPSNKQPIINADYVAFIEDAESQNKKILHVILEDGQEGPSGAETPRVKVRLDLGIRHSNFYPLALRMDGRFFNRGDVFGSEPLGSLKDRFKKQLLSPFQPFPEADFTLSQIDRKKSEDQLALTGYCIPQKLRDESELGLHIDNLLDEVQNIYFSDINSISTKEDHQSFLLLSYAHIMFYLCRKMDIDILEAFCRDDKDRGNVMKTVFKLHFLHLTGTVNHETLTRVLGNSLVVSFIVQKNGMQEERFVLLEQVLPVIVRGYSKSLKNPPATRKIFGEVVNSASYDVFGSADQMIALPQATSARNMGEYMEFLDHVPKVLHHPGNLIEVVAQEFYPNGIFQRQTLQEKIENSVQKMNIRLGSTLLSAPGAPDTNPQQRHPLAQGIAFLDSLRLDDPLKILCSLQVGLGTPLLQYLERTFKHQLLDISVVLQESSLLNPSYGIDLTVKEGIVSLKFKGLFELKQRKNTIARVEASLSIADHRTGQAQFEYSLIKD